MYEIYKVKDDDTIEIISEERNINKEMIYEINDMKLNGLCRYFQTFT